MLYAFDNQPSLNDRKKWWFWGRLILEVNDSKFNKNSVLDIVFNTQEEKGELISAISFCPKELIVS